MLFGDDSDSEVNIEINKNYADRYDAWRQKEEVQKLKDRYGESALYNDVNSTDEPSSSEDEDENAEQLTQQFDKDFFKTLSYLKKKDPSIYDENVSFFDKNASVEPKKQIAKQKNDANKPLFLRDYERKLILEHEENLSDIEDRARSPTIAEEEKLIKKSFKGALEDSDSENDASWGGLFKKRQKTKEELEKEEEDYREWLKGQKEELEDKKTESDLKYLHDYWNDPKLGSDELFLKDYILNKRFVETNDNDDYIPTYDEIIHDSDDNLSEDEKTIEKQEEFEHKFNFRFEEPDKEFIKRYPRTMESSLRKKDDRRKKKRQEVKERKQAEEARKREELKRLKALKRKEIVDKIEKLKQITGNSEIGFKDEDLEGDFDPAEHDRRMNQLFSYGFYEEEEEESVKPEFPELDEELEIENWNNWTGDNHEVDHKKSVHGVDYEDPSVNMDCDYDPAADLQNELIESTKRKKKGKKWSKFAQAVSRKKPVFDSKNHTFDEYVEEYYKLDFEDLIGDIPCRFKYRSVIPNSFGLSVDEILKADDKELNRWCSLKKSVQYRPEHVEKYDVQAYKRKAMNENLKKKIFHSIFTEESSEQVNGIEKNKSRKRKKTENDCTELSAAVNDSKKVKLLNNSAVQTNEENNSGSADLKNKERLSPSSKEKLNCEAKEEPSPVPEKRKKKKKKKNKDKSKKKKIQEVPNSGTVTENHPRFDKNRSNQISSNSFKKPHKKFHKRSNGTANNEFAVSDARLRAYGINPKKFKNKLKYGNK